MDDRTKPETALKLKVTMRGRPLAARPRMNRGAAREVPKLWANARLAFDLGGCQVMLWSFSGVAD